MSQEIKVVLATELRNTGIKATEDQVAKLAEKFKEANKQNAKGTDEVIGKLGRMPGILGKVQSVLTGTAAKVTAAFGVVGLALGAIVSAGSFLWDKVIKPIKTMVDLGKELTFSSVIKELFGVTNAAKDLERQNKEIEKQAKKAYDTWGKTFDRMKAGWDAENESAKRAVSTIEEATRAYLKMQDAQGRVTAAGMASNLIGLERDKFNAMSGAKDENAAAREAARYDILIAEEKARQEIAKYEEKAAAEIAKIAGQEEALTKSVEARALAEKQLDEARKAAQMAGVGLSGENAIKAQEKAAEAVAAKEKALAEQLADEKRRQAELDAAKVAASAQKVELENIKAKVSLEVDERRKAEQDLLKNQAEAKKAEIEREQAEIAKMEEERRKEAERILAENEKKMHQMRLDNIREEVREWEDRQKEAQDRVRDADRKLGDAWNAYKNPDSYRERRREQFDEMKAQRRFAADLARLERNNPDWRNADPSRMNMRDQATRELALAMEEQKAANEELSQVAANTKDLKDKMQEIINMK